MPTHMQRYLPPNSAPFSALAKFSQSAPFQRRVDVREQISAYARAAFPSEGCGFVIRRPGNRFEVTHGENKAEDTLRNFRTSGDDWEAAEAKGEIVAVWHSHPNGMAEATPADKTSAENVGVPFLIYAWPADLFSYYEPSGWIHPLLGRPFIYGLLDCYALVRDAFRINLGIDLPNFHRADPNWWRRGENLILDTAAAGGFQRVDLSDLRKWDVPVISLNHNSGNHCGVYLGDWMLLHHPPHRPSIKTPYSPISNSPYVRATVAVLRHEKLIGKDLPR